MARTPTDTPHKTASGDTRTWHARHRADYTPGERIADAVARGMGSWTFIIIQTVIVAAWITLNVIAWLRAWDPYPFILLNLLFSTQAAYAAPLILMSQNRQNERDRYQAESDYRTDARAGKEIDQVKVALVRIEKDKLDRILELLEKR